MLIVSKYVMDIINVMPSNKAPGIDKGLTRVLKDSPLITHPFYYVNHQCFSLIFNIPWGLENCLNHTYCQTRLPALSKVCERVAYNQFVTYLTTKERLTTKQSGNKKWFSTETSLIHTTDAFLKGIDDKKLTACVLLNLSKAFRQR